MCKRSNILHKENINIKYRQRNCRENIREAIFPDSFYILKSMVIPFSSPKGVNIESLLLSILSSLSTMAFLISILPLCDFLADIPASSILDRLMPRDCFLGFYLSSAPPPQYPEAIEFLRDYTSPDVLRDNVCTSDCRLSLTAF